MLHLSFVYVQRERDPPVSQIKHSRCCLKSLPSLFPRPKAGPDSPAFSHCISDLCMCKREGPSGPSLQTSHCCLQNLLQACFCIPPPAPIPIASLATSQVRVCAEKDPYVLHSNADSAAYSIFPSLIPCSITNPETHAVPCCISELLVSERGPHVHLNICS